MSGKAKLFSIHYFFCDFVKLTAALPGLLVHRPRVLYESAAARKKIRGGAILASNHVGFYDPIYLHYAIWYRRHHFLCIQHFFNTKRRARLFGAFLCIPIDRENFGMTSLRQIVAHLQAGELISMFPEGHINPDGSDDVRAFKTGMVLMAVQAGVPIIPVYIKKRAHLYNRQVLALGEPIDPCALYGGKPTLSQMGEIAALLHEKETQLEALCTRPRRKV